jgi:hypothetical protein
MFYDETCVANNGREACSSVAGVCGPCLDEYIGVAGDSNELCTDCSGTAGSCILLNREACSTMANTCGAKHHLNHHYDAPDLDPIHVAYPIHVHCTCIGCGHCKSAVPITT